MSLPPNPFTSSLIPSVNAPPTSLSSKARGKRTRVEKIDRISQLHDDVLLKILLKLCTEDSIKTSVLSQRWKNVWKQEPCLCFDMNNSIKLGEPLDLQSYSIAEMITKVINNHDGNLRWCKIQLFPYQSIDGTLETWIKSLTQVKRTKCLALLNIHANLGPNVLHLSPNIFSRPSLKTLFLFEYCLESAQAFKNSHNLTTLLLHNMCVKVDAFNTVIESCPSLKVLVLNIHWYDYRGCLKIHHNNLKMLHLGCSYIDHIDVYTPLLDILAIHCNSVTKSNFLLGAPRIFGLQKYYLILDESIPHICYNVSSDAQEIENISHEFVVHKVNYCLMGFKTLAVNVDLKNHREVYMLKEVCNAWGTEMEILEIFLKHNNLHKEDGESSIGPAQKNKAKMDNFFISADFCVRVVCIYQLSDFDEEAFALASLLVTQGAVTNKLMIETSSIPANKKLKIEAEVAKLMELPKEGNKELIINCF